MVKAGAGAGGCGTGKMWGEWERGKEDGLEMRGEGEKTWVEAGKSGEIEDICNGVNNKK